MDNLAGGTILQIVGGLFTIVLLPLLYLALKKRMFSDEKAPPPPGPRAPDGPVKAVELAGRYQDNIGFVFDFVAHLHAVHSQVKGHIDWTLIECSPSSPLAKRVGQSGSEFVEGFLSGPQLVLNGYRVDNTRLLAPGTYMICLSEDRSSLEGTSRTKDVSAGTMRGRASLIS